MIRKLALCWALAFLTACAAGTPRPLPPEPAPNVKTSSTPTVIEGSHNSMDALMADQASTIEDLVNFGNQCEAAVKRCNVDKATTAEIVAPAPPAKCGWWKALRGRCN